MKIKNYLKKYIIAGICLMFCLAVLYILFNSLEKYNTLFLVLPKGIASPGIDINKVEEFSKNEFLITYEIPFFETVSLAYGEFPVTVIGTTSSYPWILGFTMLEGSFFLNQAWAGKLRHAVLNSKAADIIFGSTMITGSRFRIRNETWLVSGVINDENDTAHIYIPSSVRGGAADAMALTISDMFNEAYVINNLRTLGIWEKDFDFVSFNIYNQLKKERVLVLFLVFIILLLLSLIRPLIMVFKNQIRSLKKDITRFYPEEIIKYKQDKLLKTALFTFIIILLPVLSLILTIRIIAICLPWQDIVSLSALNHNYFSLYLNWINNTGIISFILFILFLITLGVFFVSMNMSIYLKNR